MRFPFALTAKIAAYIIGKKLRGVDKFATVLQLEPLHTCNLTCTGCGRIREYSTSIKDQMPLEDCLAAAEECGAPMISICGGEPLIYPHIEALVFGLLAQRRIVYLCTNALGMRKKMREWLAAEYARWPRTVAAKLQVLVSEELLTPEQAAAISNPQPSGARQTAEGGPKGEAGGPSQSASGKPTIAPNPWLYWNVHLDGLERTHDLIVEREGVFRECIAAIRMAKLLGYQVATNTTIYKETDMAEIEAMFQFLGTLGVDGHTISPGYEYDAAKKDMVQRLGVQPETFFLTRRATVEKFADAIGWGRRFPIFGTPVYLEFLAGARELSCSAWAIPTRNIRGWKGPCYLMTDGHFPSYDALLRRTEWERYGVVNGEARDPRCENCMVHCGYEPTASLGIDSRRGDLWKTIAFNFGPKPRATGGDQVEAFNGVSAGRGHKSAPAATARI